MKLLLCLGGEFHFELVPSLLFSLSEEVALEVGSAGLVDSVQPFVGAQDASAGLKAFV